ncbi:MAG: endonuclease/exonuclease/phosphatase family protein [Armatimonadetes bacterium]|nr:endonuclease/exonuclease/phosphatase family protein [Armatimonadota bacterium]
MGPILAGLILTAPLLAYLLETFGAEDGWFTMLVTYLPQGPLTLGPMAIVCFAAWRRRWKVLCAASASLLLALHLCGPCWRGARTDSNADEAASVRVLTFNLKEGNEDPERIAHLIRETDPDICAFQEAKFLRTWSPKSKPILLALPGRLATFENLAIASRWGVRRQWTTDYQTPTHRWALFAEIDWQGKTLVVASTHLNPVHWDRFLLGEIGKLPDHLRVCGRIRLAQAESMIAETAKIDPKTPVILCGDFNGPPQGRVYQKLSSEFKDAFREAGAGFGLTIPSSLPLTRLDYVWVRGTSLVRSCSVSPASGSDHRALLAQIVP